jgi:hypothetical protein
LGRIEFQAPAETGSDAVLVAASIYAEADVTFDATNNATDLVLATAHDGAAAERVRITSQGEIGLAGANYGTDGQVMTSAGPNAAVAWETIPPGTTLSGSTNNTIATVTGANALIGEANLTFDGTTMNVVGNAGVGIARTEGTLHVHTASAGSVTANTGYDDLVVEGSGGAGVSVITADAQNAGIALGGVTDSLRSLIYSTHNSGSPFLAFYHNAAERMRIDSAGQVLIKRNASSGGSFNAQTLLGLEANDHTNSLEFLTDTGEVGTQSIFFSDNATGAGRVNYQHSTDHMAFWTNSDQRMVIDSTGDVGIGTTDPDAAAPTGSASPRILKVDGGAGVDSAIQIVGHDNNHGLDLWTDVSTGDVYFDQRGNHNDYDFRFRTKTTGTPVDAVTITGAGALSKASGSFKIDHPLEAKANTHYLVHSFIEGPQADLLYRGTATLSSGTATVNIDTAARITDGTFVALNGNVQAFTTNESGFDAVRGSVSGNVLTITSSDNTSTATISWLVVGERKDAHMLSAGTRWTDSDGRVITEPSKEADPDRMTPARQASGLNAEDWAALQAAEAEAAAKITALESA